jgi:hypothetical protein
VLVRPDHANSIVNANHSIEHRDDGKRFVVRADEKLSAFVELERQVLTVTFISDRFMTIRAGTNDSN